MVARNFVFYRHFVTWVKPCLTLSMPKKVCCWCSLSKEESRGGIQSSPNVHFVQLWFSSSLHEKPEVQQVVLWPSYRADTKYVISDVMWCHKGKREGYTNRSRPHSEPQMSSHAFTFLESFQDKLSFQIKHRVCGTKCSSVYGVLNLLKSGVLVLFDHEKALQRTDGNSSLDCLGFFPQ